MNSKELEHFNKQYNAIDVTRLFMAICVVAIHTRPLESVTNTVIMSLYNTVLALAVPFFFMATGFLLFDNMDDKKSGSTYLRKLKNHGIKLIKAYIMWSIIFLPVSIYGYYYEGESVIKAIFLYIRNLFFQGEHFYSWHLWYLLSAIYTIGLIWLLVKKVNGDLRICAAVAIVFFLLAHLLDYSVVRMESLPLVLKKIVKLYQVTFGRGRMLSGTYLIIFGMLVAKHKKIIARIPSLFLIGGVSVTFIISAFLNNMFTLLMTIVLLFACIQKIKIRGNKSIFRYMRRTSTVIYYTHMLFFLYSLKQGMQGQFGVEAFVITVLCTLILAWITNIKVIGNMRLCKALFGAPVSMHE